MRGLLQVRLLAVAQVAMDLASTTVLVHLTGGVESVFIFLIPAGCSSARRRCWAGAARSPSTAAAVSLFAATVAARRLLPLYGQALPELTLREIARNVVVYAVAFIATGALAARLAVEPHSCRGERIASQHTRLRKISLATLHADVIRCLTSGLITLTEDGRVVTLNAAAAELVGGRVDAIMGRAVGEVLPGAWRPFLEALAAVTDRSCREEVPHKTQHRTAWNGSWACR